MIIVPADLTQTILGDSSLWALADLYELTVGGMVKMKHALNGKARAGTLTADEKEAFSKFIEVTRGQKKAILQLAKTKLEQEVVYTEFLKHVRGVGEALALRLLSLPLDLNKDLTNWNAYFGLTPVVYKCQCEKGHKFLRPYNPMLRAELCPVKITVDGNRVPCKHAIVSVEEARCRSYAGYLSFWNPRAKTLVYLFGKQFSLTGGFYKLRYQKEKKEAESKVQTKIHAIKRAYRSTFKLFLAHYYQACHDLYGLDYRLPYQFEYLDHKHFIPWQQVVEFDEKMKNSGGNPEGFDTFDNHLAEEP